MNDEVIPSSNFYNPHYDQKFEQEFENQEIQEDSGRIRKWTKTEDEVLRQAVEEFGGKNWRGVASRLARRSDVQCLHRWQNVLRPGLVKGAWTREEDELIVELVRQNGVKRWSFVATHLHGRSGKQCRDRYNHSLAPGIQRLPWTVEEDTLIIEE